MQLFGALFLGMVGLIFVGLGTFNLLFPVEGMVGFEIRVSTTSALNEIRANYGGMHLALGLFFVFGAFVPSARLLALLIVALFTGGLVLGRLLSLVVDGAPNSMVWGLFALESVGALVALTLLIYARRKGNVGNA